MDKNLIKQIKNNSNFYNSIWKNELDFDKLPTHSKNDILKFEETELKSHKNGSFIRFTTGTTSKIIHFLRTPDEIQKSCERFEIALGNKLSNDDRIMIVTNPTLGFIFAQHFLYCRCQVSLGMIYDLDTTVEQIIEMRANCIRATPIIAYNIAKKLIERKYFGINKFLLSSCTMPKSMNLFFKENFNNCFINMQYGSSETAISLYQDNSIQGTKKYYTFNRDFVYEFYQLDVDELIAIGDIGELVITKDDIENPLVKYRTGDIFRVINHNVEDNQYLVEYIGRKSDSIKLNNFMLFREHIDDAINQIKEYYIGAYGLSVENTTDEVPQITFTLIKNNIIKESFEKLEDMRIELERNFYLTDSFTYHEGVNLGLYAPLKVELVDKLSKEKSQIFEDKR